MSMLVEERHAIDIGDGAEAPHLFEEAREILETVQIAYPGHERAAELMAQIAAAEAASGQPSAPAAEESNGESHLATNWAPEGKDAFDLAAELASELGEMEEADVSDVSEVPSRDPS